MSSEGQPRAQKPNMEYMVETDEPQHTSTNTDGSAINQSLPPVKTTKDRESEYVESRFFPHTTLHSHYYSPHILLLRCFFALFSFTRRNPNLDDQMQSEPDLFQMLALLSTLLYTLATNFSISISLEESIFPTHEDRICIVEIH